MRNHRSLRVLELSMLLAAFANAASGAQAAPSPRPLNAAPTLTLASSTCGKAMPINQTCVITLDASDPDRNLARVDLSWNDGTPVESRVVTGGQVSVTFSRAFSTPQTVRWSAIAADTVGAASSPLSRMFVVTAPSPAAQTPVVPAPVKSPQPSAPAADAPDSAANEEQIKSFVVMIRGTLAESPFVGAGVILGVASDRIYIATANHVVRGERPLGGAAAVASDVQVQFRWLRGEWQRAQVLEESFDETLDLAVITVAGAKQLAVPMLPWNSFVRPDALSEGEDVVPMGYPAAMPWFMPHQSHVISRVDPQVIKTEGELVPGYSGGALVTRDWGITGIILSIAPVQNNVLRIDLALKRMRDWGHEVAATFKERPTTAARASDASLTLEHDRQEAERCVGGWIAAMLSHDIPALLNLAEMPFYFDQEVVVRRDDLESRLRSTSVRTADNLALWKIQSIRAVTVGELRATGQQANRDRVLGSLSMTDSDWHVSVIMSMSGRTEGAVFFVRKVGGVMKMVGLWD
jgi:hypothetical protein